MKKTTYFFQKNKKGKVTHYWISRYKNCENRVNSFFNFIHIQPNFEHCSLSMSKFKLNKPVILLIKRPAHFLHPFYAKEKHCASLWEQYKSICAKHSYLNRLRTSQLNYRSLPLYSNIHGLTILKIASIWVFSIFTLFNPNSLSIPRKRTATLIRRA